MVLDGSKDKISAAGTDPDNSNEVDPAIVDLEFYLLNYFKPGPGSRARLPITAGECSMLPAARRATSPIDDQSRPPRGRPEII
jgi:hypothetical protein